MKYGYVKSATQDIQSINKQVGILEGYGVDTIIVEKTGQDLYKLLKELQSGDSLHIVSMEYLSRDMKVCLGIFNYLDSNNITLYVNNEVFHRPILEIRNKVMRRIL